MAFAKLKQEAGEALLTKFCVRIRASRLHDVVVESSSANAAAELADAIFAAMSDRPAGTYGGTVTDLIINVESG
jgi:hypothetical protein